MPAIAVAAWPAVGTPAGWALRLPPLFLVSFMLAQGACYWHIKYRSISARRPLPSWFCSVFRSLRLALIGLGLVAVSLLVAGLRNHGSAADLAWGTLLLGFASLEYVNYYNRQPMHDSIPDWQYLARHARLREAPLRSDLRRACG